MLGKQPDFPGLCCRTFRPDDNQSPFFPMLRFCHDRRCWRKSNIRVRWSFNKILRNTSNSVLKHKAVFCLNKHTSFFNDWGSCRIVSSYWEIRSEESNVVWLKESWRHSTHLSPSHTHKIQESNELIHTCKNILQTVKFMGRALF